MKQMISAIVTVCAHSKFDMKQNIFKKVQIYKDFMPELSDAGKANIYLSV